MHAEANEQSGETSAFPATEQLYSKHMFLLFFKQQAAVMIFPGHLIREE